VRHHVDKVEEWLSLADVKFKWSQVSAPEAAPNPTFKPEFCGEGAVGKRLRVYWPAMQKWYCGTVRAYDPVSGLHTVYYKDGDQQTLMLKHEPVIWADDELAMQADSSNPLITWVAANSGSAGDVWGPAAAAATGGGSTPRHPSNTPAAAAAGAPGGALAGGLGGTWGGVPMQPLMASSAAAAAAAAGPAVGGLGMIPVAATGAAAGTGAAAHPSAAAAAGALSPHLMCNRAGMPPGAAAAAAFQAPVPAAAVGRAGGPGGPGNGLAHGLGRGAAMSAGVLAFPAACLKTVFPPTPPGKGRGRTQRAAGG
jgi:hypothetical protein